MSCNCNSPFTMEKDPDSVVSHGLEWNEAPANWLHVGDTILTSQWSVEAPTDDESPIVIVSDSINVTQTTFRMNGGTQGADYLIRNTITTLLGETDIRSIKVHVRRL